MKTLTTQLLNLFDTGQMQYCGLYQFNLANGAGSLYFSSGDVDIFLNTASSGGDPFWANQTFSSGGTTGPYFDRKDNKAKMHQGIGLQVDTLTFDVIPASAQVESVGFLAAVRNGVFDGAELIYLGAYWPLGVYTNPVVPTGTVKKYVGNVADVSISRNLVTFTINSYLELLNQNIPLNLYQATCVNTLYDTSCTLLKTNFQVSAVAQSGSTANVILNTALSQATGYFNLGTVTFTSGPNIGVSRTVKTYVPGSPGSITLIAGFPSAPNPGDTFYIYPGCDKTMGTCANKFLNIANFRGFPFVPQQEQAG